MASQEKIEQLAQLQQARDDRGGRHGRGRQSGDDRDRTQGRGGVESTMFHPPVPGRGGNDKGGQVDAEELARQERNQRDDEARRAGRGTERPRDDRRERDSRSDRGNFRGRQDGGFVPEQVQPRREPRPAVGQEAAIRRPENIPENRTAKMILELGKVSVALKTLCGGLLKYTKHEDTESTQVGEEKTRLTLELTSYVEASDELRTMLVDKNKPTIGDLEIAKAQTTIHMLELLREVDSLDNEAISLPEKDTIEWRRLEKAKNELRLFVGDTESITSLAETTLRGGTSVARIPKAENSTEEIKYQNPAVNKLWNALHKQQDPAQAVLAWHREYVLGGGMDTYRKNNTETQLSEEKVTILKETLSILAENFREIYEIENRPELYKGEANEGLPTGWADFKSSRRGEYLLYAEILSGNINPKSPYGEVIQKWSVADFEKELERIKIVPDNLKTIFEKARTHAPTNFIPAVTSTVTPEPAVAVEPPSPLTTPDAQTEPVKLSTEKYNEVVAQLLEEHLSGKIISKEELIKKGFTEEQAEEFMQMIK